MKQSYRIAIKMPLYGTTHYVIRDSKDLDVMLDKIRDILERDTGEVELIKFVPIPALEEV